MVVTRGLELVELRLQLVGVEDRVEQLGARSAVGMVVRDRHGQSPRWRRTVRTTRSAFPWRIASASAG
jgi:hypothetical protein